MHLFGSVSSNTVSSGERPHLVLVVNQTHIFLTDFPYLHSWVGDSGKATTWGVGKPMCTRMVLNGEGMHFTFCYTMVQPALENRHLDSPRKALISDAKLAAFKLKK